MPRPTTAHVFHGFLTVVLATLTMLLATGARSGAAVVSVAAAGLLLGLAVAVGLTAQSRRTAGSPGLSPASAPAARARIGRSAESRTRRSSESRAAGSRAAGSRAGRSAEPRVGEHSLRR